MLAGDAGLQVTVMLNLNKARTSFFFMASIITDYIRVRYTMRILLLTAKGEEGKRMGMKEGAKRTQEEEKGKQREK